MRTFGRVLLSMAVCLFVPAGDLGWVRGWVFLLVFFILMSATFLYLWRINPELLAARSRSHRGGKPWDRLIVGLLFLSLMAIYPVAGLDDGRFHWSSVPSWLAVVGFVLLTVGEAIAAWTMGVNKFAEPTVRIQTEREHQVVSTGPYAIVRHPLYLATLFWFGGAPLALGSFWALIPGAIAATFLVVRTALEDQTLQNELDGYTEYAERVRYWLLPGVW